MKFDFELLGIELLQKKLKKETIQDPVSVGVKKIAVWVRRTVMVSTPVRTNRLRPSITSEIVGQSAKIGTVVDYAPFVEYGTKHMEARHVQEGGSQRIMGIGPFTYTMQLLQEKMAEFIKDMGKAIEVRFG